MNFGIGSTFSKSPESAFSEGPGPGLLYKVCRKKVVGPVQVVISKLKDVEGLYIDLMSFEPLLLIKPTENYKYRLTDEKHLLKLDDNTISNLLWYLECMFLLILFLLSCLFLTYNCLKVDDFISWLLDVQKIFKISKIFYEA